jgi:NAD(P)-dependent dehydrogenase (short-subunit alcohol dehydrogenase family)
MKKVNMIDFAGQAVIVTGAGRGLGRHYALDLAHRGAMVVVNDLGTSMDGAGSDAKIADDVVAEIKYAGGMAIASYESVESPESAASIVQLAVDAFGRLDAVVSNAGIFQTLEFDQLTPEQYQRMRSVHLDGGFYLSQAAFRVMKTQGSGRFVFISSSAGMFGQPNSAHYGAAKAGLVGLANVIAIEGAEHGILANTVLPFGFSRMVTETVGADAEKLREESEFLRSITPELVVPIVVFLASKACTFTHHIYSAMAGQYARVFIGLGDGWEAGRGVVPTAEDVADHLDQLSSLEPFTVPMSVFDEISFTIGRLGITS